MFCGKVSAIKNGAINDEITLVTQGGAEVVACITKTSTEKLGLSTGKEACALIKASNVIIMTNAEDYLLSTRNCFTGTVSQVVAGAVNGEVKIDIDGGITITSIITMESIKNLGLKAGVAATAIVKASHVILAVKK